jgi:hypothetical protein
MTEDKQADASNEAAERQSDDLADVQDEIR